MLLLVVMSCQILILLLRSLAVFLSDLQLLSCITVAKVTHIACKIKNLLDLFLLEEGEGGGGGAGDLKAINFKPVISFYCAAASRVLFAKTTSKAWLIVSQISVACSAVSA